MDGIRAVDNSVNIQMTASLRRQGAERSATEEATESQAEKVREQQQNAPSANGAGTLLNLLA